MGLISITFEKDYKVKLPPIFEDVAKIKKPSYRTVFPKGKVIPLKEGLTVIVGSHLAHIEKLFQFLDNNSEGYLSFVYDDKPRKEPLILEMDYNPDYKPNPKTILQDFYEYLIKKRRSRQYLAFYSLFTIRQATDRIILLPKLDSVLNLFDKSPTCDTIKQSVKNGCQVIAEINDITMIKELGVEEVFYLDTFSYISMKQLENRLR